jgi:3'-5' exoribonuclease
MLHHAWIGGLLEHVLTLVRVCLANVPFYPEVDSDLLVTGAILHDIGKVRELHWKSSFGYTLEGQLIGHISIAQGMLLEKVRQLEPFPEKLRILVEHMILSHHGKYEFGSPKLPMTPEALLLNTLDDLEAKMQTLRNAFAAAETQGKGPGEVTDWVRSIERPLFNSQAWLADGESVAEPSASVEEPASQDSLPISNEDSIPIS